MQDHFAMSRPGTRKAMRHVTLAFLACVIGAIGFAPGARAADTLKVGKAIAVGFTFVPLDVGMRTGIFKKYGLQIESSAFRGDAKLQQAMAAGGIDIALGSAPAMAFIAKGSPVKAIAATTSSPLVLTITVRPDGPKTVADLKGKKISVSTKGSLTNWLVMETSRLQGWGPNGIEAVPLGATKAQIIAMERGDVDGQVVDVGTALQLQKQGKGRILVRFGNIKDFITHVIYATDKDIASRPDDLRKFVKAWFETIAYMRSHKAETVKIAADVMHKDMQISSEVYDELMPMFKDTGTFPPKAMATLGKSWIELGILKQEPDLKTLYTDKFLPK
jgi:ABC-type nitrate/sulfonate/bicarbonate transport system substrate-binding protein